MVSPLIGSVSPVPAVSQEPQPAAARRLGPSQRQELVQQCLAGTSARHVAQQAGVSRKFVGVLKQQAQDALDRAFARPEAQEQVLCHLPITKQWLRRFVVGAALIGHASDRDIQEFFPALLGQPAPSLGAIHNILREAAAQARSINEQEDLSTIRVAALDELFQSTRPILVGMDLHSTYCFLMQAAEQRDADTWGYHLLELSQQRHLHLERTIADGGRAIRAAQAQVWPEVPCNGDVFHALRQFREVVQYAENQAVAAQRQVEELARRRKPVHWKTRHAAQQAAAWKFDQAENLAILYQWLADDVLALAGPPLEVRRELYDFIVDELQKLPGPASRRQQLLLGALRHQREALLGFVRALEESLQAIANDLHLPLSQVHQACRLEAMDKQQCHYWQGCEQLYKRLGPRAAVLGAAVRQALADTPRASSLVENLNGRVRNYVYLWRGANQPYLDLVRFYLNHRPYQRSAKPQRVGKSPYQLLSGQQHRFWLDMLLPGSCLHTN